MTRHIAAPFLAIGIVASLLTGTTSPQEETRACLYGKINSERVARGIPRLPRDARVEGIAQAHAERMRRRDTPYHNMSLDGRRYGENVGMVDQQPPEGGTACEKIHESFMSAPPHRSAILNRDHERVGVGVAASDEHYFVVEDFYDPAPQPPPKPEVQPQPACTCPGR